GGCCGGEFRDAGGGLQLGGIRGLRRPAILVSRRRASWGDGRSFKTEELELKALPDSAWAPLAFQRKFRRSLRRHHKGHRGHKGQKEIRTTGFCLCVLGVLRVPCGSRAAFSNSLGL